MKNLKKQVTKTILKGEEKLDLLTFQLKNKLKLNRPLQIVTYRSYGTPNRLYVKGRVLVDKGIRHSEENDTTWENLLNMYRRFETDEVPNARVQLCLQDELYEITTDAEGYFVMNLEPKQALQLDDIWHDIEVNLVEAPMQLEEGITETAHVLVPPPDAEYGIISDIDDTIVRTGATNLLEMGRTVLLNNAHSRIPFHGVSQFYRSLQLGRNGKRNNPFFYVSSSPWNNYDLLYHFLELNEIPQGPLLLRDFGIDEKKFLKSDHMSHKYKEIENLLITYPSLNFILVGDSGQQDAAIYREVVKNHPGRIIAIYIRDVNIAERTKAVQTISDELKQEGEVEMVLVKNTAAAAAHAADCGYIFTEEVEEVEKEARLDEEGDAEGLI
ncbi:phosphatidate phosphatase APP1 [Pontibacter ummariensis]|uniref:Phosphatidate phosphatase APP1 n=1 Tax=Pontibacter ummariensis TaxID=1610492 RepID=A0A239FT54_9BACT|nr:phosphatase domain-containing protein [Pontibacter ummariensis]PRY11935.1 phosphatidate phosphatase APP1 [Pontibacter ummariensis]SNS60031.1 Phosphatidate phosphatase APP1 [Pontibacter ummariensis]